MVWNLLKTDEIKRNLVNKNSAVVLWTQSSLPCVIGDLQVRL